MNEAPRRLVLARQGQKVLDDPGAAFGRGGQLLNRRSLAIEVRASLAESAADQPLRRIVHQAEHPVKAPDSLIVAEDQHDASIEDRDLERTMVGTCVE